ncbi:MAG: hypothetical protein R3B06_01300 [Kofleriaceae bacterium]
MSRLLRRTLVAAALFACACGSAFGDRAAPAPAAARPLVPIAVAPDAVRSPYAVEIVADDGDVLDTFFHQGRYYVRGAANRAYTIRVTNPTARRVEAVVSVDGLDVIDGENGDTRKRGYIVPAYGEVRIDGWRTSLENVAAFRFSSVTGSYAGRKGKARNVGVIAVALFDEQAQAMIVAPQPYRVDDDELEDGGPYGGDVEDFLDRRWQGQGGVPSASRPAPGRATAQTRGDAGGAGKAAAPVGPSRLRPAPPPPPRDGATASADAPAAEAAVGGARAPRPDDYQRPTDKDCCGQPQPERLGLGTEYGEQRYSAATYTRFVRASDKPVAIAELRYNDDAGLTALGILLTPAPDAGELMTRETADPFPGDRGFAAPPAGIR